MFDIDQVVGKAAEELGKVLEEGVQLQVELAREDLKAIVMAQLCIGAIASAHPEVPSGILDKVESLAEEVLDRSVGPEDGGVRLSDDDLAELLPGSGDGKSLS